MVVLLIKQVIVARCTHHVVNAMAGLAVARGGRVIMSLTGGRVGQPVASLPRHAAIFAGENACGRNAYPELFRIVRVGNDRV